MGAGASCSYGYPIGSKLIKDIISNINNDEIILPNATQTAPEYLYGWSFVKDVYDKTGGQPSFVSPQTIPIQKIDIFKKLKERLREDEPVSIDNFLRDNSTCVEAAKIMIVYTLLKFENIAYFSDGCGFDAKHPDNWYTHLYNDLSSGINATQPLEILDNKCHFITFNYDISLDFYLFNRLKKSDRFKNDDLPSDFITKTEPRIIHVYGQVRELDSFKEYGNHVKVTPSDNTARFIEAINHHKNIKTIEEERQPDERIIQLIKSAEEIFIIGFGFDRSNLDMLGFPTSKNDYVSNDKANGLFHNKTIKWLNYKGEMGNTQQKMELLGNSKKTYSPKIIISKADKISSAYQHDFKETLY